MAMTFAAQPAAIGAASVPNPNSAPYFVDGKWVFTKDGKPRKPGAMKHMWVADDFDEWPDGFLDSVYGEDTEAADHWWRNANDVLKKKPNGL